MPRFTRRAVVRIASALLAAGLTTDCGGGNSGSTTPLGQFPSIGPSAGTTSITVNFAALPRALGPIAAYGRGGDGVISGSSVTFRVSSNAPSLVGVYDTARRFGWTAISPSWFTTPGDNDLDATSTAVSLVYLAPGIYSADVTAQTTVVTTLRTLPSIQVLARQLQLNAAAADPLAVPTVASAFLSAVRDASHVSASMRAREPQGRALDLHSLALRRPSALAVAGPFKLNETNLTFGLDPNGADIDAAWAFNLPFGNGIPWLGSVYRIDTTKYQSFGDLSTRFNQAPWRTDIALTQQTPVELFYLAPQSSAWDAASLSHWFGVLVARVSNTPSENATAFPIPSPQLPGGAYSLHAYSCGVGASSLAHSSANVTLIAVWPSAYGRWLQSCEIWGASLIADLLNAVLDVAGFDSGGAIFGDALASSAGTWEAAAQSCTLDPKTCSSQFSIAMLTFGEAVIESAFVAIVRDVGLRSALKIISAVLALTADVGSFGNTLGSALGAESWQGAYIVVGDPWPTSIQQPEMAVPSGELYLSINDNVFGDNTGYWNVSASGSPGAMNQLQLPGNVEWMDSGIMLSAGERVTFSASGRIYIGNVSAGQPNISNYQTPAGDPNTTTAAQSGGGPFAAPGLVPWSLVGKIGSAGAPFEIGTGTTIIVNSIDRRAL